MKKIIIGLIVLLAIYLAILAVVNRDKNEFNSTLKENHSQDTIKINDTIYRFKKKEN